MFEPGTLRHFKHELDTMLRLAGEQQDPEGLAELATLLEDAASEGVARAAARQREINGWPWASYAKAFGVSRQGIHKRLARGSA